MKLSTSKVPTVERTVREENTIWAGWVELTEGTEATEQDNQDTHDEAVVAEVRLEGSLVCQRVAVDAVALETLVPPDGGVQDAGPRDHAGDGGHVGEVTEHGTGLAASAGQEREQREGGADQHADPGQAVLARLADEAGGLATVVQSEQGTRRDVHVGHAGGPGRGKQGGVDDGRQNLDAGLLEGDDEGRLGGRGAQVQRRVTGRHQQADDECGAQVEQQETDPDVLDGAGHRLAGVGGLGRGDGRHLRSNEGEGGADQTAEETQEAAP